MLLTLVVGLILLLVRLSRSYLKRMGLPALVGFILLGVILQTSNLQWHWIKTEYVDVFEFLAKLGLVALLFRIGLESNIKMLFKRLKSASLIWIGNILVSFAAGFATAYYLIALELIPSLFIGSALVATSVGISVGVWREAERLKSRLGEILTDVAELDDITGIIIIAVLFSIVPLLRQGSASSELFSRILQETGWVLIKIILFGAACVLFSRYLEKYLVRFFKNLQQESEPIIVIAGLGIFLASLAGLMGFSLAIGAFFAGAAFSRDPEHIKIDAAFSPLYSFLSPFFFIGIGLKVNLGTLTAAISLGLIFTVVAVLGKLIGTSAMALFSEGWKGSTLLGVSMVPRAEIALIIMQKGFALGAWAVSSKLFSAMVFVSAVTCILTPLVVRAMLNKWPQAETGRVS
jgi:Kef-type K+ transport system membrane component KefB